MRIACWILKATDTRSQYVIPIAFLQQLLGDRASMLRYAYVPCFFIELSVYSATVTKPVQTLFLLN